MNTINCSKCGQEIEISEALQGQIEAQVIKAEQARHHSELEAIKNENEQELKRVSAASAEQVRRQLDGERELLQQQAAADLEMARKRLEADANNRQRQIDADNELKLERIELDAQTERQNSTRLREQLDALMTELRHERQAKENAMLEAQKRLDAEESRIRETATREADERQRLNLASKDKTITDLQKAMDDMQRKAAQGSQQLQGEIMELDFETALTDAFRDDMIEPIAKGTRGGDIRQIVRMNRGTVCGVMLWEIKRTKNWTDGWTAKLKEDLRNEKANVPIIITEAMPKSVDEDIALIDGVWVCKPQLAIVLGTLLRKSLVDTARERTAGQNKTTSAEALYTFVTSHEFVQQIEVMVETYQEMTAQVTKERIAYEKLWSLREKQAQRLMIGTAAIIGSMQGQIGAGSMPRIKGLDLLDAGEDIS